MTEYRIKKILLKTVVVIVSIVIIAAAAISWDGLTNLALNNGFKKEIAWLTPIVVDGCIVLATTFILYLSLDNKRSKLAYATLFFGTGFSVWGNIQSSNTETLTGFIVHAIAPVALFLSVEILSKIIRSRFDDVVTQTEAQKKAEAEERKQAEQALKRLEKKTGALTSQSPVEARTAAAIATKAQPALSPTADAQNYTEVSVLNIDGRRKTDVIREILEQSPEMSNSQIAKAMSVELKTIATSIKRVKDKMADEALAV